jgi:cell division septation protein DedD
MEPRGAETGTEFILDNRKLIIGFMLLIIVCGVFFVIGFMEGKRQAVQARVQGLPAARPGSTAAQEPGGAGETAKAAPPVEDRAAKEGLDWYKSVQGGPPDSRKGGEGAGGAGAAGSQKAPFPIPESRKPAATPSSKPSSAPQGVTYSVQVGAFKSLRSAEIVVDALKAKGYVGAIEDPTESVQHYLVKVGRFASRADAVAMQLKLKKDGFSCILKTN